jgi:hypothetical protein
MNATTMKVQVTFTAPLLGAVTKNKQIYTDYQASKAPELPEDEIETVPDGEKGTTGFHEIDGSPILYDYVVKGFFKDACGMLRRDKTSESFKLKAYKKIIDGLVFVTPRQIPIVLPDGEGLSVLERPLRASTAQGERIALARSDTAPIGTMFEFTLEILGPDITAALVEWLDYGRLRGFGQWRNSGYGRFTYEILS